MRVFLYFLLIVAVQCISCNCSQSFLCAHPSENNDKVEVTVSNSFEMEHPRLLLFKQEEKAFKKFVNSEQCWINVHNQIIAASDKFLEEPLPERKLTGRRLLDVSRKCLRDIFFLSYSYRMTGDKLYAKRAEQEMLAICDFQDWNPSHFLDVGEMSLGVAIGYDWLYDYLSEESRDAIAKGLLEKGIEPSFDSRYNGFLTSKNNWSQVCNAGMLYAAIAIYDKYEDISKQIIERSVSSIYMDTYAPDGAYPEGAGYWSYGTSFAAMFMSALVKLTGGNDYGLLSRPGVKETPIYAQQMIAPDGKIFNYSDSEANKKVGLNTTLFWFASCFNNPTILWMQKDLLYDDNLRLSGNRLLPALLIWARGIKLSDIKAPESRMFVADGVNPIALMRTSWNNTRAKYLGFKSGTGRCSHAHLDVGSFVFVSDEVRWAEDLGMQDYESLESKGLNIWNYAQDSERWTVQRYNNMSHNTLTFDGKLQQSSGKAKIDKWGDSDAFMYAISDLSSVYAGQAEKVVRGTAIVDQNYAVIRDEIVGGGKSKTVTWNMATKAKVVSIADNHVILQQDDRKLMLRLDSPFNASFLTKDAAPVNSWDAANKGVTFVYVECPVDADENIIIQVSLLPDWKNAADYNFCKSLTEWK